MNLKILGLCIIALAVILAAGCTDDSSSTTTTTQPTATTQSINYDFSGSGDGVTDAFDAAGFTTFTIKHTGDDNFVVRLLDADSGKLVHLMVNEIGDYSGDVAKGLDGTYRITVVADGPWSISLR